MKYAFFNEQGRVETAFNDDTVDAIPQGAVELTEEQWWKRFDLRLSNGELVNDPAPVPSKTLEQLKSEKNTEINTERATANCSTFMYSGKSFSCDMLSRGDIDGINGFVALYAALPPSFPGAWKSVDNSIFPIPDVNTWKTFYAAMVAAGAANFAHSQQLKTTLAAATTAEQVAAIVW